MVGALYCHLFWFYGFTYILFIHMCLETLSERTSNKLITEIATDDEARGFRVWNRSVNIFNDNIIW